MWSSGRLHGLFVAVMRLLCGGVVSVECMVWRLLVILLVPLRSVSLMVLLLLLLRFELHIRPLRSCALRRRAMHSRLCSGRTCGRRSC